MSDRGAERRNIYVGNIGHDTPRQEVEKFFAGYGDITKFDWKTGFCFIEYDNYKDASYVVEKLNGWSLDGRKLTVQFPHGRGPSMVQGGGGGGRPPTRPGLHGVRVLNLSSSVSWQDLKDFGKKVAHVTRSNVFVDDRGRPVGLLEFSNEDDAMRAIRNLDGEELKGTKVEVTEDRGEGGLTLAPGSGGGGGGGYRSGGGGGGGYDRDRDRDRDRRRSRSPPRRSYDDRRSRSPRRRTPERDRGRDSRRDTPERKAAGGSPRRY